MKHLNMTGYQGTTATKAVPIAQIPDKQKGMFMQHSDWDEDDKTVTIKFTTVILLSNALTGKELAEVTTHERVHEADFHRLANQLKRNLEAALKKGDVDVQSFIDWFNFDICSTSAAFHRKIGAPTEICSQPSSKRP